MEPDMDNVRSSMASVLCLSLLLGVCIPVEAKCPTTTLAVGGEISETVNGPVTISVTAETPKGDFTESVTAAPPSFEVAVPFSTLASYSPLRGHRCTNVPTAVVVTARIGERQLTQLKMKFKGNVVLTDSGEYRLRSKVVIDLSGIQSRELPTVRH